MEVSSEDSITKDLLIIPSIKFVSLLTYIYKTFSLNIPTDVSILYEDAEGK